MREDITQDTSPPPTEDKLKNKPVREVEEWIATTVKETLFDYIKSKAWERQWRSTSMKKWQDRGIGR
jgi:hypothetical protein